MALSRTRAPFQEWARRLIRIEAPGIRTAAAAVVPIIAGQLSGHELAGVMVGLGGLYVSITDKPGASVRSLLAATAAVSGAAFVGAVAAEHLWSAILLTILVAVAAGLLYAGGELAGQIGFAAALVCAVGVGAPATGAAALERLLQFAGGGVWASLLTWLLWRWEARGPDAAGQVAQNGDAAPPGLAALLSWRSHVVQHAARLALAAGVAVCLYKGLRLERGYWLIITVLVIMKPEFSATHQRALQRVVGSLVGGALALALTATFHNLAVLDLLLIVLGVLAYSHASYDYGLYVAFLTPFVILMINTATPGDVHVAFVRIYETVFGGALAWIIAYLLRPRDAEMS